MSIPDNPSAIGMDLCLKGLLDRNYIPNCILDIGAALGEWTRLAMRFWPQAQYFLIEPLEERHTALEQLKRSCPNVNYILAGAADKPGKLSLGVTPDLYASSFTYAGAEARSVDVVTVDELFRQKRFPQPQLMKLDVQGFELNVLKGAATVMSHCDLILLELQFFRFSPSMHLIHESIAFMADRSFYPYEIADVLRRPLDGAMGQCDILFARKDHWLTGNSSWM